MLVQAARWTAVLLLQSWESMGLSRASFLPTALPMCLNTNLVGTIFKGKRGVQSPWPTLSWANHCINVASFEMLTHTHTD